MGVRWSGSLKFKFGSDSRFKIRDSRFSALDSGSQKAYESKLGLKKSLDMACRGMLLSPSYRTTAVTSPGRTVGSCKSPQGQTAETTKRRTQPNPLRLSLFSSLTYIISRQSEPIEVKILVSNWLRRKKARFSRNMDGARRHYSRFAKDGNSKLENRNSKWGLGTTNEAGMFFSMNRYIARMFSLFPIGPIRNWNLESRNRRLEPGISKLETGNQKHESRTTNNGTTIRVQYPPCPDTSVCCIQRRPRSMRFT